MSRRLTARLSAWPADGPPQVTLLLLAERDAWVLSAVRSSGDLLVEAPIVEAVLPRLEVAWLLAVLHGWGPDAAVEGVVSAFVADHADVFERLDGDAST